MLPVPHLFCAVLTEAPLAVTLREKLDMSAVDVSPGSSRDTLLKYPSVATPPVPTVGNAAAGTVMVAPV